MDGIFYDCMDGNDTKMPRIVRRGSFRNIIKKRRVAPP